MTREIAPVPDDITVRRVLFRIRDKNEAYAVIATPKTPGKFPGILVLHGSGGSAEEEKAMAWAERGYVAVAPDMPGLYSPLTHGNLPMSKGYADGRYTMQPDTRASGFLDKVFDGALDEYLAHALGTRRASAEELERLEQMIAEAKQRTCRRGEKGTRK